MTVSRHSTAKPFNATPLNDAFCLRLTVAMLYRAGLDAMDELSPYADEAHDFLSSDFALLALQVLQSKSSRDIDWGDVSDYLGHLSLHDAGYTLAQVISAIDEVFDRGDNPKRFTYCARIVQDRPPARPPHRPSQHARPKT